ncbi:hypothetical protein ACFSTC_08855 [Nonomuraea ferruginea]
MSALSGAPGGRTTPGASRTRCPAASAAARSRPSRPSSASLAASGGGERRGGPVAAQPLDAGRELRRRGGQPSPGAAERRPLGERVHERPVGQAQRLPDLLGRHPGIVRAGLGVRGHDLDQPGPERLPVLGIGDPRAGDGLGGRRRAHGGQLVQPGDPPPPQLRLSVGNAVQGGQLLRPPPRRTPATQRGRPDVEYGHPPRPCGCRDRAATPDHRYAAEAASPT